MTNVRRMLCALGLTLCAPLVIAGSVYAQHDGDLKEQAARFLARSEPRLEQTTAPSMRLHMLVYMAPAALCAGETEKAEECARELMKLREQVKSVPGFGPGLESLGTHVGNVVLGELALSTGDVAKAKKCLLAAAEISGSPSLSTFGPDMRLAQQLIERGERDTVLEYFDACAKFWEDRDGKLEHWKTDVQQGNNPNFGANVAYILDTWRFTDFDSTR